MTPDLPSLTPTLDIRIYTLLYERRPYVRRESRFLLIG